MMSKYQGYRKDYEEHFGPSLKKIDAFVYKNAQKYVENNKTKLIYVPSADNVADLMTKPATKIKLSKFRKLLFGSTS